jgi:hypothetical protein
VWNRLKSYTTKIEKLLKENPAGTDWSAVRDDLLIQTGFFQHERLIHLLVTLFFALLMVIFLGLIIWSKIWLLSAAFGLIFIMLIFYFVHYYRLENGTQKLYTLYDRINEIIKRSA